MTTTPTPRSLRGIYRTARCFDGRHGFYALTAAGLLLGGGVCVPRGAQEPDYVVIAALADALDDRAEPRARLRITTPAPRVARLLTVTQLLQRLKRPVSSARRARAHRRA